MTQNTLANIRNFILLTIAQALIFSQIHLFGYATAYVYLIFILKLPRHTSKNALLMWGFSAGLIVDIFCNTPGINASAATAMSLARNTFLSMFTHNGLPDDFVPGAKSIKWGGYMVYSLLNLLTFYIIIFLLEVFTTGYAIPLLISISSSTLLTMLFVIVTECFSHRK